MLVKYDEANRHGGEGCASPIHFMTISPACASFASPARSGGRPSKLEIFDKRANLRGFDNTWDSIED